jgi:hypothetical protein
MLRRAAATFPPVLEHNCQRRAQKVKRLPLPIPAATLRCMNEDESVELDAVAAVARITALEMLVRQMMIVQLRILDRMGEIKLTPDYIKSVGAAYAEKVDASPIIESNSPEVNYEFKVNVLHNLERFFDELEAHVKDNPA